MSRNERTPLQLYAQEVIQGRTQKDSISFRIQQLKQYIAEYKTMLAEAIRLKESGVSRIKAGHLYAVDVSIDFHIAFIKSCISGHEKDLLEQRIKGLLNKVPFVSRLLR